MRISFLAFFLVAAGAGQAATMVNTSPGGEIYAISPPVGERSAFAVSWTQSRRFETVSIQAVIGEIFELGAGSAYLMRSIGPGVTAAEEVASRTLDFPLASGFSRPSDTVVFSNLTLDPGTYHLVIVTPFSTSQSGAYWFTGDQLTEDSNVNFLGSSTSIGGNVSAYAPSSEFLHLGGVYDTNFLVNVAGRESLNQTPEPSSVMLMLAGGALILVRRRAA